MLQASVNVYVYGYRLYFTSIMSIAGLLEISGSGRSGKDPQLSVTRIFWDRELSRDVHGYPSHYGALLQIAISIATYSTFTLL